MRTCDTIATARPTPKAGMQETPRWTAMTEKWKVQYYLKNVDALEEEEKGSNS
jgi:hypothetical protein